MIPTPDDGGLIGRGQQRRHFVVVQKRDERPTRALRGNGQHALNVRRVLGVTQRGVAKQRVNGREPGVAGARTVASINLQVVEKRPDERGVDVLEAERRRGRAGLLPNEGE